MLASRLSWSGRCFSVASRRSCFYTTTPDIQMTNDWWGTFTTFISPTLTPWNAGMFLNESLLYIHTHRVSNLLWYVSLHIKAVTVREIMYLMRFMRRIDGTFRTLRGITSTPCVSVRRESFLIIWFAHRCCVSRQSSGRRPREESRPLVCRYGPLQMYWNSEAGSVFSIRRRRLGLRSRDGYETIDENFSSHFAHVYS